MGKGKLTYNNILTLMSPVNGKIMSVNTKEMVTSKLPSVVLRKLWKLGYVDQEEEYVLGHHFQVKLEGHRLPTDLPPHLILSSKQSEE